MRLITYQDACLASYLAAAPPQTPSLALALIALADGRAPDPLEIAHAIMRVDIDRGERGIPSVDG